MKRVLTVKQMFEMSKHLFLHHLNLENQILESCDYDISSI